MIPASAPLFVVKNWKLIAGAAILVAACGFSYYAGRSAEEAAHEKVVADLNEKVANLEARERVAKETAKLQVDAVKQVVVTRTDEIVQHFQERLHEKDDALAAALERVRRATAAAKRAPAGAAPAACRGFDAPPAQLSEADREFLVRLGAEADRVVEQARLCKDYAVILHKACSAPEVR